MTYQNPQIPIIPNPIGFDAAIADLQQCIAAIPYITKSFGRAYIFKESRAGKQVTLPKVYQGGGEYHNPLPNGELTASSFILPISDEQCDDFQQHADNTFTRRVAIIFWGNLKQIDPDKDYVFLEEIKMDFLDALQDCKSFKSYESYVDDRYSEIFREFSSYMTNRSNDTDSDEINTQYLMYPYGGFRMSITLTYNQPC